MPEGDTIFKAARTLNLALAGQTATRFETVLVHLARVDDDAPIAGRTVERVEAAGKHLLMIFSGPSSQGQSPAGALVLRTHMRMNGSWHLYRPGERWQLPASSMRIRIETPEWVAVAFKVHVAEFVHSEKLPRHRPIATLGPDLLSSTFDRDDVLARMKRLGSVPIADVLLNQRVLAGIGNVYKSETLFLAGVHPETRLDTLTDAALLEVIDVARSLLQANVVPTAGPGIVTYRGLRRTTRRMKPEDRLWVYSRGGRPCRRCGTAIASKKSGLDARVTYWCPNCQKT